MPKRLSKMPIDVNQLAARIVEISTREELHTRKRRKNPAAVALGRLGGLKGGKARMEKLTPERRREIASDAARARWANKSR